MSRKEHWMNEQTFNPGTQPPNKVGPFLPGLKARGILGRFGEQSRVEEFFTPLYVKGRIVSADALHTHASVCASITASAGDYLLFAKGNQPTLREDLRLFFREPPADCRDWRTANTTEKGHGRVELRDLVVSTELNDFLATTWPGIAQVFFLRRRVQKALICTQEMVYGFTSLTPAQAGPDR